MKKEDWKNRIEGACVDAGTYKPFFDSVIDSLAIIMEARDAAQEEFEASGCIATIEYTNKGGATNLEQNPALRLINDLNRDALAYWRELGLTPAALKKINESAVKPAAKETSPLAKALAKYG